MIITRRVYEFVFSALAVSFFLVSDGRGIASAAEMVGEAHRIVNSVTGVGAAGNRRLSAADPVYRDEDVSALVDSRGELTLMDGSRLVVGENSTITLDDFVIAGDSFSQGTISVAKGAFRFISGNSGQAIEIHTPLPRSAFAARSPMSMCARVGSLTRWFCKGS